MNRLFMLTAGCVLLAASSLMGSFELSIGQHIRVVFIAAGLTFLFLRYGERFSKSVAVPGGGTIALGPLILAVVLMFLITEFDAALSRVRATREFTADWYSYISIFIVGYMAVVFVWRPVEWRRRVGPLTMIDVLVVVAMGALLVSLALSVVGQDEERRQYHTALKLLQYVGLWFVITRAYDGHHDDWREESVRKASRVAAIAVIVSLAISSCIGLYRVAVVLESAQDARWLSKAGNLESAILSYEAWKRHNEHLRIDYSSGMQELAVLYGRVGDDAGFAENVASIRALIRDRQEERRVIARVAVSGSMWKEAIAELEELVVASTARREDYQLLATSYLRARYTRALFQVGKEDKVDVGALIPISVEEEIILGRLLLRLGRPAEAARRLVTVTARDANLEEAHYLLGLARARSGNCVEAVSSFRTAVELVPSADSYYQMGSCLDILEGSGSGREYYGRALDFLPEHRAAALLSSWSEGEEWGAQATGLVDEDVVLAGYRLPEREIVPGKPWTLGLFWYLRPDWVATPKRIHFLLENDFGGPFLINAGPHFSRDPADWEPGELIETNHQFVVEELAGSPAGCGYRLKINTMYDHTHKPSRLWASGNWAYSQDAYIDSLCLSPSNATSGDS